MARRKDSTPGTSEGPSPESLSYEQAVAELEAIIDRIENGEIGLEDSLAQFRRGELLLKRCRGVLSIAEQQVRELDMTASREAPAKDDHKETNDDDEEPEEP